MGSGVDGKGEGAGSWLACKNKLKKCYLNKKLNKEKNVGPLLPPALYSVLYICTRLYLRRQFSCVHPG